jgi:3-dehydroquinate synthase
MQPLEIKSAQGNYSVEFLEDIDSVAHKVAQLPRVMVVLDRVVASLYSQKLAPIFNGVPTFTLDATEDEKTLAGVTKVASWLQKNDCNKQNTLVAIGGGIIQDIVAFSAHVYYRGVKWVYVPTTLLGMSDSCIGAKCCINLNNYKNQLGAFHSPAQVLLCPRFTETLPDRDIASGYGEILKLMWTGSAEHFQQLENVVARGGLRTSSLPTLLRASLEVKKSIIEVDEYESGLRRTLNYGHTFGHALEGLTNHFVPHGLAVAWGMDLVNYLAWCKGMLSLDDFQAMHAFIRRYLPFQLPEPVKPVELIQFARRDKKVADGQINLILATKPGCLQVVKTPFDTSLEAGIAEYTTHHDVFANIDPGPAYAA